MEYNITSFDHKQGTFVVLYNDDVYLNMPAPRKNGAYCSGQELENYIQWRHPSILKSHLADLEPLLVDENPNTDLPNEILQKAALYQPEIQ